MHPHPQTATAPSLQLRLPARAESAELLRQRLARVEVTQENEMQKLEDNPIEQRVVQRLVDKTNLQAT